MKNYLLFIFNKLKTWGKAKVEESKQPLSRENAYVLSSIGEKHGDYADIVTGYNKRVLKDIEAIAKMGEVYLLKKYPPYLSPSDKEAHCKYLIDLGYTICYANSEVILITWKYSAKDFTEATDEFRNKK